MSKEHALTQGATTQLTGFVNFQMVSIIQCIYYCSGWRLSRGPNIFVFDSRYRFSQLVTVVMLQIFLQVLA